MKEKNIIRKMGVMIAIIILLSLSSNHVNAFSAPASGYYVQHGTAYIPLGTTTYSVPITTVSNVSRAFVITHHWANQRATAATGTPDYLFVSAYLPNESAITFERATSTDGIYVTWMVVEALNNEFTVQRGRKDLNAFATTITNDTLTTAVNASSSLAWQTLNTSYAISNPARIMFAANLTSGTNINFIRDTGVAITGNFRWFVAEFDPAKVTIKKGIATLVGSETSGAPLYVSVNTTKNQSFLFFQCVASGGDNGADQGATAGAINNDTTLKFYTYDNGANDFARECYYTVVDFGSKVGNSEQQDGIVFAANGVYNQTDVFASAVQPNKSLAYLYATSSSDNVGFPSGAFHYNLTDINISYYRIYRGLANSISWRVLELPFNYWPNVTTLSNPREAEIVGTSSIDFQFKVNDEDGRIENCTLYGNFSGAWGPNDTVYNPSETLTNTITISLPSGSYKWNIKCIDEDDDSSFYWLNHTFSVDVTPPAITSPSINITLINQSNSIRLNVTVSDLHNISSVNATILYPNGSSLEFSLTNLTATKYYLDFVDTNNSGTYNITQIAASDEFGNTNTTPYSNLFFNVTLSPPSPFSLLSPENNTESQDLNPLMNWTASWDETFDNYTLLIDTVDDFASPDFTYYAKGLSNITLTLPSSLLEDTTYFWMITAYDVFGSSVNSTQIFKYITDNTAPLVELTYPNDSIYVLTSNVEFNYTISEANTLDSCVLYENSSGSFSQSMTNSSVNKSITNTFTKNLLEGSYLWNVWCNDSAQNNNFSSQNRTFIIDLTPPSITLIFPDPDKYENTTNNIIITINATDNWTQISNCSLIVNDAVQKTRSNIFNGIPYNFTEFMLNGNYTWSVNCTDTNGFIGESEERNITIEVIDANPPLVTLNLPISDNYSQTRNITFNYTAEDATGIQNCSLYIDGTINQTDTAIENFLPNFFNITNLAEALHNWTVKCYDNSTDYNLGISNTRNITIDLTNPIVTLNTPANNSFFQNSLVTFNYTPTDSNIDYCALYTNETGSFELKDMNTTPVSGVNNHFEFSYDDARYLWNIHCYDKSGREGRGANNYTLKVDTLAPAYSAISAYPESPANYSPTQTYYFNITWQDVFAVDKVWVESNFSGVIENITLNASGNVYMFNITTLAAGSYYYKWHSNDSLGHKNETDTFYFVVDKSVSVLNLTFNGTEGDRTINESDSLNITARLLNPSSGYIELYLDEVLINNGSTSLENVTQFMIPGTYNLTAYYYENQNYTGAGVTYFVTVNDISAPVVSPIYPLNATEIAVSEMIIQYSVSDYSSITNCSLYINDTLNQTDTTITKDTTQIFNMNLSNGMYRWNVKCYDENALMGQSEVQNFTISISFRLNVTATSDRIRYIGNMTANLTANITDKFGSPTQGNATIDVIFGNTTTPWWNGLWKYRRSVALTNPLDFSHRETVYVNISDLTGYISDCDEIRIVEVINNSNTLVNIENISGNDASYCYVKFNAYMTANAVNETNYQVYFGNNGASSAYASVSVLEPFVQRNLKTVGAGSNPITDSITEVNTSKAFVLFASRLATATSAPNLGMFTCTLNPTSVQFERYSATNGATVSWQVIGHPELNVQRGLVTQAANEDTSVVTINAVNLNNSFIIVNGRASIATAGYHYRGWSTGRFNDSTTIIIERASNGSEAKIDWQVVEWNGAKVQNGSLTLNAVAAGGANVNAVNTSRSFVVFNVRTNTSVTASTSTQYFAANLTNATYINFSRTTGTGVVYIQWFLIEMPNGTSVQKSSTTVSNPSNVQVAISPVTVNKTMNMDSWRTTAGTTFTNTYMTSFLYSTSLLNLTKQTTTSSDYIISSTISLPTLNFSSSTVFDHEMFIATNNSETDINGLWTWSWNTTNNSVGNYSIIATSSKEGYERSTDDHHVEIILDIIAPNITLVTPVNEYNTSNTTINFTWTPVDEFSQTMNCTIFTDSKNVSGILVENNVAGSYAVENISVGYQKWNVSCKDYYNNENTSTSWNYTRIGSPTIFNVSFDSDNKSVKIEWQAGLGGITSNVYISEDHALFSDTPNFTGITDLNWTDSNSNSSLKKYYRIATVRGDAVSISNITAGKRTIDVNGSWALVSFPLNMTVKRLGNFSEYKNPLYITPHDAIIKIYRLNATGALWQSINYDNMSYQTYGWVPSIGSENFTTLEAGEAYWLELANNATITHAGIIISNTFNRTIKSGWNLIGPASMDVALLPDLATEPPATPLTVTPADSIWSLWLYDSLAQDWNYTEHGVGWNGWFTFGARPINTFEPDKGYYAESADNATWEVLK